MKAKDSIVEIPQTILWYEGIRVTLKAGSPYSVEKLVEPHAFRVRKGTYSHNNKWSRYQQGLHLPQKRTQALAEQLCPGSSKILIHPLFKVAALGRADSISNYANGWLLQLAPDIVVSLFRLGPSSQQHVRRRLSYKTIGRLKLRGDLDALAALAILLREAAESGRQRLTMTFAGLLYDCFANCVDEWGEGLRRALPNILEMLVTRVFCFARDASWAWSFDGIDCPTLVRVMDFCRHGTSRYRGPNQEFINVMVDRSREHWILGLSYLRPPLRPIGVSAGEAYGMFPETYEERFFSFQQRVTYVAEYCATISGPI